VDFFVGRKEGMEWGIGVGGRRVLDEGMGVLRWIVIVTINPNIHPHLTINVHTKPPYYFFLSIYLQLAPFNSIQFNSIQFAVSTSPPPFPLLSSSPRNNKLTNIPLQLYPHIEARMNRFDYNFY
jgi:hypothetical protein